ncbi:MAG: c-type cytochrome [Thiotrichaceae bacterium]|nr:c-type cytochrome [Thiotrichaceae bacterium]
MTRLNRVPIFKIMMVLALCLLNSVAVSEDYPIDLDLGEEINQLCAGCHGEYGEGGKKGEYPRLAGLPAPYLATQIQNFKKEIRKNMPMRPYTNDRELPDEDIPSLVAFLSQIKLSSKIPKFDDSVSAYEKLLIAKKVFNIPKVEGDIELGEELYVDDCQLCHGERGWGKEGSETPPIAGQYTQYMLRQINDFATGVRWHEYAEALFAEMEEDELQAIMAYLSVMDD